MEVTVKVRRFNPEVAHDAYWQTYSVSLEPQDAVLAVLMKIREDQDGSLAFRASCRSGICGSDGMLINGQARLACKTLAASVIDRSGMLVIEPLANLPCLKDLVVDQTPFWERFRAVMPWLMPDPAQPEPQTERRMVMDPARFDDLSKASDCIFCQICYTACPIVGLDPEFLGPQALIKAFRFEADPRDHGTAQRFAVLNREQGVWRCHTTFNCTASCPKGIPITKGIQALKRALVWEGFRR
jgi:succinate dehydrogenase / fumarate reductase iron-sulfur subunit